MPRRKQPAIPDELLDQLLAGSDPRAALADGGLLDGLKKAPAERALNAELDHHLDGGEPDGRANSRNGYGSKSVLTGTGKLDLQVPRDRLSTFVPQLIAKYQRRFPGFDDKLSIAVRSTHVRAGDEHPRDPGPPARAVRHRGLARPGQRGHRRRAGRGRGMAEPPARGALPAGLPRRDPGEGARRRAGTSPKAAEPAQPRSATRPSTSRSASGPTAPRRCWGSGSSRPRAPSSGRAS
jgi:hypothetical protein